MVVLGDHGEMLGEHGEQTHGFFIYDAATRIPLIVAGPGVPAREIADQVRIVDVMPTALELLGVPAPQAVQGVSLLPARARRAAATSSPTRRAGTRATTTAGASSRSVQDGRFKYIRAPRPELYDLRADPRRAEGPVARTTRRGSPRSTGRWSAPRERTASADRRQGPAGRWTRRPRSGWPPSATWAASVSRATSRTGRAAIPRTRSGSTTC